MDRTHHRPTKSGRGSWRRVRIVLALVVGPLALLGLFELGLRAAGYGYSTRVLVEKEFRGERFYATNKAFFQQFFSLPIDNDWDAVELQMRVPKPKDAYRVLILGGSAALSAPPDFAFSLARVLEVMLRTRYPKTRFEVYNLAHCGANSHVMRAIAKETAKIQPDLFVVYMGNNEINGPFGAVTAIGKRLSWSLPFIRAKILLTDLRMAQLAAGRGHEMWQARVEAMDQEFSLDDPRMKAAYRHFQSNLEDICAFGARAGAAVVVCTVGCNLRDWRPTLSINRRDLSAPDKSEWEAHYQAGVAAEETGAFPEALRGYGEAMAIDDTHAELQYRVGRCHWEFGDYDRAREHFVRAWDSDFFRARVPRHMNELIARVARDQTHKRVHLVDAARCLAEESPHGIPGREFFYDNVHMTFKGNYVVGRTVFEQVVGLLPSWIRSQCDEEPTPLSRTECEERLGLSSGVLIGHLRSVLRANDIWWHQSMDYSRKRLAELEEQLGAHRSKAVAQGYCRALELSGPDWFLRSRYVRALLDLNNIEEAVEQAHILVSQFPLRRDTYRLLGIALARAGRTAEAVSAFQTGLALYPDDTKTRCQLGFALQQGGELDAALDAFREASKINRNSEQAKWAEGGVLERQGDLEGAVRAYRELVAINPRAFQGYASMDSVFEKQNDLEGRLTEWTRAVQDYPDAAPAHLHLGMALEARGHFDRALDEYQRAYELDGSTMEIQVRLGRALVRNGDYREAVGPLKKALAWNTNAPDLYRDLVVALCETDDYDAAREVVEQCDKLGITLPDDLIVRLTRVSGDVE